MKRSKFYSVLALVAATTILSACKDPNAKAPIKLIRSDYKAGEVTQLCEAAMKRAKDRLDAVAKIPADKRNAKNTLLEMEAAYADLGDDAQPLTFMGYVSTDEGINKEGSKCEEDLGQFSVAMSARRDLYNTIVGLKVKGADLSRLLAKTLEGYEQSGLKLSDTQLAKVTELKKALSEKETKFSANLNTDKTTVKFSAEELTGVTQDFLGRLQKADDGNYIVTTKSTDYLAVIQNASNENTRHKMALAYLNRGGDTNIKLLQEAIVLREQIAKLMGYATWADYRTVTRMAKNGKTVLDFMDSLKGKLAERNHQDLAQLLKFKQERDPSATVLNQWDVPYFAYQLQKRDYQLDDEEIRQYFPADVVISGMFSAYSQMLGVNYVEVKDAKVWSPDVKLYEIHDKGSDQLLGYFYTDFIPRANKYGHAAAFPLISGRVLENGAYSYPVSSIVANLSPPSADKPSLLTHDDVETIFHEFGHIMHQTLTRAPYASLSGSAVAQDFVEAPSQMLENWVWSPKVLPLLSGHYKDHSQKLPQALLDKMLSVKDFQQGYAYTKQLLYGSFDMKIHTQDGPVDVIKTYDGMFSEIMGMDPMKGGRFAASFGHLMGGYDAGYYGYLWSQVYAQDMFSKFEAVDLLSPDIGAQYRKIILEQGNMKDAIDLLREFLGREPNSDAFFKKLHI